MRWGAFYTVVLLIALVACTAIEYLWVPPFVAVWDSRAHLEFVLTCGAIALIGGVGLSSQTPWQRLPRWVRFIPVNLGIFVPLFLMLGLPDLSPTVPIADAISGLLSYAALGTGVAVVLGLLSSLSKSTEEEEIAARRSPNTVAGYLFVLLCAVCVISAVLLLTPRARDDIRLEPFETFTHTGGQLMIGVTKGAYQDNAFGMIKIIDHGKANSVVMEPSEWSDLVALWNKAKGAHSTAWSSVGEVKDTAPSDPSRLELWVGSGVRLVISSPNSPTVSFQLAPGEINRFGKAAARVRQSLHD